MARIIYVAAALLMVSLPATVRAQDVPGIEICTVEKTMERRTSCLQSNVDFLQKTADELRAVQNKMTEDQKRRTDTSASKDNAVPVAKDAK